VDWSITETEAAQMATAKAMTARSRRVRERTGMCDEKPIAACVNRRTVVTCALALSHVHERGASRKNWGIDVRVSCLYVVLPPSARQAERGLGNAVRVED